MFEFKGLVASSAKKYNENTGFATPLGKKIVSRSNVFSEKFKVVLGDMKNTALLPTPKIEKGKHNINKYFLSTPKVKNVQTNELLGFASPTVTNNIDIQRSQTTYGSCSENNWNEWDACNEKLALSDETFRLLFLEPNENLGPHTPPSLKEDPLYFDIPSISGTTDYAPNCQQNDDDIPPINMDFLDVDLWDDFKNDDKVLTEAPTLY